MIAKLTRAQRIEAGKQPVLARMRERQGDEARREYARRVTDHFARLSPNLFEGGVPGNFAEVVLDRVDPRDAWHRIEEKRCVLCGRNLTSDQAVRYCVGPECFERVLHGHGDAC